MWILSSKFPPLRKRTMSPSRLLSWEMTIGFGQKVSVDYLQHLAPCFLLKNVDFVCQKFPLLRKAIVAMPRQAFVWFGQKVSGKLPLAMMWIIWSAPSKCWSFSYSLLKHWCSHVYCIQLSYKSRCLQNWLSKATKLWSGWTKVFLLVLLEDVMMPF